MFVNYHLPPIYHQSYRKQLAEFILLWVKTFIACCQFVVVADFTQRLQSLGYYSVDYSKSEIKKPGDSDRNDGVIWSIHGMSFFFFHRIFHVVFLQNLVLSHGSSSSGSMRAHCTRQNVPIFSFFLHKIFYFFVYQYLSHKKYSLDSSSSVSSWLALILLRSSQFFENLICL